MSRDEERGLRRFERFLDHWSRRDFLHGLGAGTAWALFLAGGGWLKGCGNAGPTANPTRIATARPVAGGQIVEAIAGDLQTLNPVLLSDPYSAAASAMVYDALYMSDYDGSPLPLLARDLPQVSGDGKTYTVTLGEAAWTDGQPITAEDVRFTYDLMWHPDFQAIGSPRRAGLARYVSDVRTVDQKTVVFELTQPYPQFVSAQLECGILPQHVYGGLKPEEITGTPLNTQPQVTSGPFRDLAWQPGRQASLRANKGYHRGAPRLDRYILKVVTSPAQLLSLARTGEIDVANGLDPAQYQPWATMGGWQVSSFPSLRFISYLYNLDPDRTKLFQDPRVRQALLFALDRQTMARAIFYGQATLADSTEAPPSWAHVQPQSVYPYDRARAEQLLDDAGFKKGADGIRARGDVRLEFEMLTSKGDRSRENLLVAMEQLWREIGVDAIPNMVDLQSELLPQIQSKRTFRVLLTGSELDPDPDQRDLWSSAGTAPSGLNGMDYRNPKLDQILQEAAGTPDRGRRKELYRQMQEILAEDLPAPMLFFLNDMVATHRRVRGFTPNALADRFAGRRRYLKDVQVVETR